MNEQDGPQWRNDPQGSNAWSQGGDAWGGGETRGSWQDAPGAQWQGQQFAGQQPTEQPGAFGMPYAGQGSLSREDDRLYALISHLAGPLGMLFSAGWLGFIGPLIVWLVYKDRSPYVRMAAARSFNFSLAMTVASIVAWFMLFTIVLIPVSVIVWIVVFVMEIFYPVKAAIVASGYGVAAYPFEVRVLS